jgi:hypothetical protein
VIVRVAGDRVVIDLRTVTPDDDDAIATRLHDLTRSPT